MAENEFTENQTAAKPSGHMLGEILESVAIAVILAIVIRVFLFQPFYIPSGSMEPTLLINDRIIVSKLNYRITAPDRGDVIVFKYPVNPKRDFIKRVIGLPGETIKIKDNKLFVDGKQLEQPFLPHGLTYGDFGPVTVPEGEYFMMGDNRNNSEDSRVWGTLPRDNIVGRAVFVYWPFSRASVIR